MKKKSLKEKQEARKQVQLRYRLAQKNFTLVESSTGLIAVCNTCGKSINLKIPTDKLRLPNNLLKCQNCN